MRSASHWRLRSLPTTSRSRPWLPASSRRTWLHRTSWATAATQFARRAPSGGWPNRRRSRLPCCTWPRPRRLGHPARYSISTAPPTCGPNAMKTTTFEVHTGRTPVVHDITRECSTFAREYARDGNGLLHVFVPHATAGVAILELGSGSDTDLLA